MLVSLLVLALVGDWDDGVAYHLYQIGYLNLFGISPAAMGIDWRSGHVAWICWWHKWSGILQRADMANLKFWEHWPTRNLVFLQFGICTMMDGPIRSKLKRKWNVHHLSWAGKDSRWCWNNPVNWPNHPSACPLQCKMWALFIRSHS